MVDELSAMRFRPAHLGQIVQRRPFMRYLFYGTVLTTFLFVIYYNMRLTSPFIQFLNTQDVSATVWETRAQEVKQAFLHAYRGYELHAAPFDELMPITDSKVSNFNGWGVTAVDALDTMILMGLEDEYNRALLVVQGANFSRSTTIPIPYFETIIRYLGGFLSAYALSGDRILIDRAEEMVANLEIVFNTDTGLPYFGVNPTRKQRYGPNIGSLAEIASLQLEYYYLAKVTGKQSHFKHAHDVMQALYTANLTLTGGMHPIGWNITSGKPYNAQLSVGARADSAHEYLLKHYLMTSKEDKTSLEMYIRTSTHIITDLLFLTPNRQLLYVTDTTFSTYNDYGTASHVFEHLSCFLPGLLALGAHTLPLDDLESVGIDFHSLVGGDQYGFASRNHERLSKWNLKQLHMWAAEGLAQTCWLTYADQPTGLGPDEMAIYGQAKPIWDSKAEDWVHHDVAVHWLDAMEKWKKSGSRSPPPGVGNKKPAVTNERDNPKERARKREYYCRKPAYLLRPETVESLYILWRITGDHKWRTRGWEIFKAIQRETITSSGFACLKTVEMTPGPKVDSMPSYFLAETLKYLYLMFKEEDLVPLDEYVFNTEAHPLPIFNWTKEERALFFDN